MQDYKVHQILYNKLHPHDDLMVSIKEDHDPESIVTAAVAYFHVPTTSLVFPAKSYAVAIIYSYLIEKYFGTDFFSSLNDHDLFCQNDKFFLPYSSSKPIYDKIIQRVGVLSPEFKLNESLDQVAATIGYFKAEFGKI